MKEEFRRQDEVEMYRLSPSKRLRVAPCMLDQVFAHYGGHFVSMVAADDDTFLLLDDLSGHSGDGRHVMLTADVVNSSSQLMKTVTEFLVGAARGNFALYRRNDPPLSQDPRHWKTQNRQNNCFLNATIAALAATPELLEAGMEKFKDDIGATVQRPSKIETIANWSWFNIAFLYFRPAH